MAEGQISSWRFAAGGVAIVAAIFSLIVTGVLVRELAREQRENPLAAESFTALREKLSKEPDDAGLRSAVRDEDARIRREYFQRRRFVLHGAYLLLGGLGVLALAVKVYFSVTEGPAEPGEIDAGGTSLTRNIRLARWALVGGAATTAVVFLLVSALPGVPVITSRQPLATTPQTVTPLVAVTDEMMRQNWPAFRGYNALATVPAGDWPTDWDGPSGRNILWKTATQLPGRNSPIVWNDKLFICGADPTTREVYCYSTADGKLLWKQVAAQSTRGMPEKIQEDTGYAPPTMATDGNRVFALFASGDMAAFDMAGNKLWAKSLGVPDNGYGHASSLITFQDRLIVQYDQGQASAKKSAMFGLDVASGREVWRVQRPVSSSWASPIIIPVDGKAQLITTAEPFVIAYDPASGEEIWRAKGLAGEVAPSPAFANGTVYAAQERADLLAIPTSAKGDITKQVLWKQQDNLPDVVSLAATSKFVYSVEASGKITAYDVANKGEIAFEQEMGAYRFHSSPIVVGDLVYLTDHKKGTTFIFKAEGKWSQVAAPTLDESVEATPAFVNGRIYVRSAKNLYCIGTK